jgi:hypothetical protein
MHRLIAPALLIAILAGPAAAETRALTGFDEVHASDKLRVEVTVGEAYAVEVDGADAGRVRTRIDGDELRISDARRPWIGSGRQLDAVVRVTMPEVRALAAARGAELRATLSGPCDQLTAVAAMGATTEVEDLQCDSVEAAAAMGGTLRLAGTCRVLDATAAMGGNLRADRLQCETVDASAAMGGDVRAYASQSYDASAAMGGSVNVAGDASEREQSTAMGGSVTSR